DNGLYRPRALIQCLILLSCSMRRPPPCYTFFPYTTLFRSMGALREFATAHNIEIQHCKPHGALFMQAMEDKKIARAILESVYDRSEEHTSELQSRFELVCRLLLEKNNNTQCGQTHGLWTDA